MSRFALDAPEDLPSWDDASPGDRVRLLRVRRGLTQAQLAHRAGVGVRAIYVAEQGPERQTVRVIRAIAGALHVRVGALFPPAPDPDA